jgi:hypothetical protein
VKSAKRRLGVRIFMTGRIHMEPNAAIGSTESDQEVLFATTRVRRVLHAKKERIPITNAAKTK